MDWFEPRSPEGVPLTVQISYSGDEGFIPYLPATYLDNLITRLPRHQSMPLIEVLQKFFGPAIAGPPTSRESLHLHLGEILPEGEMPGVPPIITTTGVLWGSSSSRTLGLNVNWKPVRGSGTVANPGFGNLWAWVIDRVSDDTVEILVGCLIGQLSWYEAHGTRAKDRGKAPFETIYERRSDLEIDLDMPGAQRSNESVDAGAVEGSPELKEYAHVLWRHWVKVWESPANPATRMDEGEYGDIEKAIEAHIEKRLSIQDAMGLASGTRDQITLGPRDLAANTLMSAGFLWRSVERELNPASSHDDLDVAPTASLLEASDGLSDGKDKERHERLGAALLFWCGTDGEYPEGARRAWAVAPPGADKLDGADVLEWAETAIVEALPRDFSAVLDESEISEWFLAGVVLKELDQCV